jgi:hypothetical protein
MSGTQFFLAEKSAPRSPLRGGFAVLDRDRAPPPSACPSIPTKEATMTNSIHEHDDLDGIIASLEQAWLTQAQSMAEALPGTDGQAGTAEDEWWGD